MKSKIGKLTGGEILDEQEMKMSLMSFAMNSKKPILSISVDKFWDALKQECCVNPSTAKRCIIVEKKDVENAFKRVYNN